MRSAALITGIVMTLCHASPILAQEEGVFPRVSFRESVGPGRNFAPFATTDHVSSLAVGAANSAPPDGVRIWHASEAVAVPHHRAKASARRLLIGALIGGAAGAALGYKLGSKCGFAPRAECVADGQLTAGVFGGLGAVIGISIAGASRP